MPDYESTFQVPYTVALRDPVFYLSLILGHAEDYGLIESHEWPDLASRVGGPYVAEFVVKNGARFRLTIERESDVSG
jgi:hypothetical protein